MATQLGNFDPFLDFGGVVARALAVAWEKSDFRRRLQDDAVLAMEGWLGYRTPWSMKIVVVDASSRMRFDADTNCWEYTATDRYPKLNSLLYHLPNPPTHQSVWPVALTAYNNTGPQYPFTCCF